MNVGLPPKPNLFFMNQSLKFRYFGIMKIAFMLILKSKKICESAYLKGNVAKFTKMRFLVIQNPNEGWKVVELKKKFENWSGIKII